MKRIDAYVWMGIITLFCTGCESLKGPEEKGEFRLSSEKFGSTTYYLMGYLYEESEFYRYPYQGEKTPDLINEGYLVLAAGGGLISLPGFNTPGQINGFALIGEFESLESARSFYEGYDIVEDGLQFETVSDTVELYQVWVQQTSSGNYVKLLVKDILDREGESGTLFNDVVLEYTYQSDGSTTFPN
jgi:hypothetical protein